MPGTATRRLAAAACCMLFALTAGSSAAADALRCGNKVISRGDHEVRVLRYCGKPIAVRSWVVQRGVVAGAGTIFRPGFGFVEDVVVEEWTYNFGPNRLMRRLRLENGLLRDVKALDYGFRERPAHRAQ